MGFERMRKTIITVDGTENGHSDAEEKKNDGLVKDEPLIR